MMAMINAKVARKGKKGVDIPDDMEDSRSMAEFYSELLSFGPSILKDAIHKGDPFERFKLTLKFAFSIIHNITNQDVKKRPIVPIVGETYEGHFILNEVTNVFMETDYIDYTYIDLLTLADVRVKVDQATTYIHIEGPKKQYQIYGNITYVTDWKGNNLVVSLKGSLKVKFFDLEGEWQVVEI